MPYANPARERRFQATWQRNYRTKRKLAVIAHYSNGTMACACCGVTGLMFLTLDHIDGNGAEHRRSVMGHFRDSAGSSQYTWIISHGFPPGFQILCSNCNLGKHINGGICPHEEERQAIAAARWLATNEQEIST